jgi:crotonobetainyl-CoA:carnitine CoA-transferase CaiB-like acyl-CoA transferase
MAGILEGVRVLDFGRYIAGPFCGAMLGDLGAEVIRIDKLGGSEDRWIMPVGPGQTLEGSQFLQMNRNKLGLTLNPTKPAGRELVKRLVKSADVVIANLPVDTLKEMGLDYDQLSAVNPRIILAQTSMFGAEGPYAERVGFDTIGQAMSGAMYVSGFGDAPTRIAAPYVDFSTALLNTVGILAALMERQKSGKGQKVETALLRTAINISNTLLIEQAMLQTNRGPTGNRAWVNGPADSFKCKDGWIFAMTLGQPLFVRWAKLMGEDSWLTDPRFRNDLERGNHGELLSKRMGEWCAERTSAEALALLAEARIPGGPVYTPQQVLDDEHVKDQQFLKPVDYPGMGQPYPLLAEPVKLSRTPVTTRRRPPTIGEHTDQILQELGYAPAEIEQLRKDRVV